jgi:hypothetical protein
MTTGGDTTPKGPAPRVKIGGRSIALPHSRPLRMALGAILVLCGALGFLPILGFWMIPLGLAVLSYDWPPARRAARKVRVWLGRLAQAANKKWGRPKGMAPKSGSGGVPSQGR